MTELVEPDEFHDVEYEDENTGLWWVDMVCVNCLRVTNEQRQTRRRQHLESLLAWSARHPEKIADNDVDVLLDVLGPLAQTLREKA